MNQYRVTTESGSVYEINVDTLTGRRVPGEGASSLTADGDDYELYEAPNLPVVGERWYMKFVADDDLKWRMTTTVTSVEDLSKLHQ